ncbi:MlaC/ttg2D family ABC transporter substrate-binding protein [Telmatospirillum siberiense]|nr:ABC transporter substrate-binding protein [Telmatospirillum siberiense]
MIALALMAALPGAAYAQSPTDARSFIEATAQSAIATMADKQLSRNDRDDRFRALFVSAFDIPEIGRFVLSRHWRTATPEQQHEFLTLFEEITVLTWARRFQDYDDERLETLEATKSGERDWMVSSRIVKREGPPNPVQWRIRQGTDGAFRITDIIAEGVSMAITLRSDYASTMQANGGRIDTLLATMRTKLDQLRAAG